MLRARVSAVSCTSWYNWFDFAPTLLHPGSLYPGTISVSTERSWGPPDPFHFLSNEPGFLVVVTGAGLATVMLSFLLCTYYNVILTWAMYYMFSSFQSQLPWSHCNNTWNTPQCWDNYTEGAKVNRPEFSVSPSQEFFE